MSAGHYPAEIVAREAMAAAAGVTNVAGDYAGSLFARAVEAATSDAYPTSGLQKFGFAIIIFFPILAFIVVCLRVYSRVSTKQFGIDDALIVVALVISIAETGATYMFMKTNFIGIHIQDVPKTYDVEQALIWNFAVQVLYNPILALVKTSMLLFLLKLGSQKPGVRWCIHVLNTLNLSLMVAIFLVVIFQCKPIRFNWDPTIEGGTCIKQGTFYLATAALTIFTDVLSLALPFWVFLDLKMPVRVKIALLFVFLLGALVTVVGIVRLDFIYKGFFGSPAADPTYTLGFCTSGIETNLAIICASAPSLRGLIRNWFPRFFSSNRQEAYDYRYPDSNGYGGGRRGTGGRGGANSSNPYGTGSVATNITSRRNKDGSFAGGGLGDSFGDDSIDGFGAAAGAGAGGRRGLGGGIGGIGGIGGGGGGVAGGFALRDLKGGASKAHTAVNSSPSASEEEIMTYNGIVRTTNVQVHYDRNSQRKGSISHDRSGGDGSSMGMRTSISGSL